MPAAAAGQIWYAIGVEPPTPTPVRIAQPADTAALVALINRAYAIEAFFVDGDRTTSAEIEALIAARGLRVLDEGDGIAAAVLYYAPGERVGSPASHAYFGMLAVQPELQGRGVGRRMIEAVEGLAAAHGATAITLRVINLREELRRWYAALGYREVGTAPYTHRALKRPCHFVEMAKPLAGAT